MNAREFSYKALNKILINNENSDTILMNLTERNKISELDKKLLYALTKGIIKRKIYLDYIIEWLNNNYNFKVTRDKFKNLIRLGLFQLIYMDSIPDYAAVNETINICRKLYINELSNKLNAILRTYLREKETLRFPAENVKRMAIEFSFPSYLIERWLHSFGKDNTVQLCNYFNESPQLDLHFYGSESEFEEFLQYLKKSKINFSISKFFPTCIKVFAGFDFRSDPNFEKGKYYIQDESTFLPVKLLNIQGEEKILDICAAPGGKTFDIANRVSSKVYANDISLLRLDILKENAERLNFTNIEFINEDGTTYSTENKFDKILLDAPCSGYGVIQKKPEIRLKNQQNYKNLIPLQQKLLENCANLLKDDGILVYSTCTMNEPENQEQIKQFIEQHHNFILEDAAAYVDNIFVEKGFVQTVPHIHRMDGSFVARMRKVC